MPPRLSAIGRPEVQDSPISQERPANHKHNFWNQLIQTQGIKDADFEPPLDRLCSICLDVVTKSELLDQIASGHHSPANRPERWPHHNNLAALWGSVNQGCHLCSLLYVQCCSTLLEDPICNSGQLVLRINPGNLVQRFELGLEAADGTLGANTLSRGPEYMRQWEDQDNPSRTNSTASQVTLELARSWLSACQSEHADCSRQGFFPVGEPKRLLVLSGSPEVPIVRLEQSPGSSTAFQHSVSGTSDNLMKREYLTLSHCWGKTLHLTLNTTNHRKFLQDVPFGDLPQTFKDAVSITLRLGYNALWIDALCIIQDDKDDVAEEIPRMGTIYGNSTCTIAALSSRGSDGGCLAHRIPLARIPCQLWTKSSHFFSLQSARMGAVLEQLDPDSAMGSRYAPQLHTRGWVVQERALSPRTLYFGKTGIHWECGSMTMFESPLKEFEEDMRAGRGKGLKSFKSGRLKHGISKILRDSKDARSIGDLQQEYNRRYEIGTWHDQWWHLVAIYTSCSLTHISDRWPGINGIAAILENVAGASLVAGLWRSHIDRDILWYPAGRGQNRQPRRRLDNSFPSWSWLSVDSCVSIDDHVLSLKDEHCIASIKQIGTKAETYALTIDAPMARIPKREDLKRRVNKPENITDSDSDSSEYEWATAETMTDLILERLCQGKWTADVPYDEKDDDEDTWSRHWLEKEDIWALQWTLDDRYSRLLIVSPLAADHTKWRRLGQYRFSADFDAEGTIGAIGERRSIKLY